MNSLQDIFKKFCRDFKQRCNFFVEIFRAPILQKNLSVTAYDSSGSILCDSACVQKLLKDLWCIDSVNAFSNVPPKIIKRH